MHLSQEWKLTIYYPGDNTGYKKVYSKKNLQPDWTVWAKIAVSPDTSLSHFQTANCKNSV